MWEIPDLAQLVELLTVVVNEYPRISKGRWFDSSSSEYCNSSPFEIHIV